MKLNNLVRNLISLQNEGHGDKQVFSCHGASGACDEVGSASVTYYVGESGPFDLDEGEEYVSIYIGY